MKTNLLAPTVVALTLGLASLSASASMRPTSLLGEVAPISVATRTIPITAKTRYVNVNANETVKFETSGTPFAVNFAGIRSSYDLNQIAPAGALDHEVKVYIAPDPLYID